MVTGCGGGGSSQSTPPPSATLALSESPASPKVYAGTTFTINVSAVATGTTATPTVTLGALPAGLSSTTAFPLSVPSSGAQIALVADKSLAAGSYTVPIKGIAGAASAATSVSLNVQAGLPPTVTFIDPNGAGGFLSAVNVAPGSTATFHFNSYTNDQIPANYNVALSAGGLPAGVTAAFAPAATIIPGQSVTVTLRAAANAPAAQNTRIAIVGTPQAPVPNATVQFLLTVGSASTQAPANRTDYLSLEGSPNSAVYDAAHNLIYAGNPTWNRIDVLSNATHSLVKSIPVPSPTSVDIAVDGSKVWVATASQRVYAIDTATYATTLFSLPEYTQFTNVGPDRWHGVQILALSDGKLMLLLTTQSFGYGTSLGALQAALWDPITNTLTGIAPAGTGASSTAWELVLRSGDGTRVYSVGEDSGGASFFYDVASKTVSQPVLLNGYASSAAVNRDGSRIAVQDAGGLNMLNSRLAPIGRLPGGSIQPGFGGGLVFSDDGKTLYEESMPGLIPFLYTIDASSLQARSIAPALPMIPVMTTMAPPFYIPQPFAVDATGMVLGLQDWGIAFDDATFAQNYVPGQSGSFTDMQHMSPYAGPLSGGTVSTGFGNATDATPAVWYGNNQGIAASSGGTLSITSPPSQADGPVNVKMLFPNGVEVFNPLFFAYGSLPQYAILSGSSPDGGAPGVLSGYGLPADAGSGTLTIGGTSATITTQASQYPPFTAAPFPETFLNFTMPPGSPGWADLNVTTPHGSGVLPKAIFYAQSVKDYPSSDPFHAIVYDAPRRQLYLSSNGQIDVFSLSSNQFVTPLTPPAQTTQKSFAGMALTPDGLLLAANLTDGSLAVIDPDSPASAYAIPIAAPSSQNGCAVGPLYVAAAAGHQAFVITGALPPNHCSAITTVYRVDLTARSASINQGACGGGNAVSSANGNLVVLGKNPVGYGSLCTYNVSANTYQQSGDYRVTIALSADGNVFAAGTMLADAHAATIGWVAQPAPYYQLQGGPVSLRYLPLQQPKINDSGSLYFLPAANLVDIVDVQHGLTRLRFSLKQTVQDTVSPLAIDSGGRHLYLITDAGLTLVDLGSAPLSIGSLSTSVAGPGTSLTLRGSGFSPATTATVSGQPASVNVTDENTLRLTLPSLAPGPHDITLQLPDGNTYTLENAITLQ